MFGPPAIDVVVKREPGHIHYAAATEPVKVYGFIAILIRHGSLVLVAEDFESFRDLRKKRWSATVQHENMWGRCILTSLNFFEASSEPALRSGCHFNACRRAMSALSIEH